MDKKLCATLNGRTYCLLQDADWEAFKREFKALEAVSWTARSSATNP